MVVGIFSAPFPLRILALFTVILLGGNIIPNLLHTFHAFDVLRDRVKFQHVDVKETFDYIVVGGGSAGCVVSSRLTENENVTVLLLEAGGDPNPLHSVPVLTVPLLNRPHVDWRYFTVPQKNACLAMNNQQCAWPRGKSLGGSSNLNFMIYARGFPRDYDNWADLTHDERWAYRNVLPFFKKSENYQGNFDNEKYHGHDGPLAVGHSPYRGMSELFVQAGQEFGYPRGDPSAEFNTQGFSPMHMTEKNGKRHSVYRAFVHPVRHRRNLFIYKFAHVSQILFDGPENRAMGVKYWRHGKEKIAYANKEVIISAGALNTPQILMLSGIGPRNHLESLQIPVRLDLPVGQNLQDHISSLIGPFIVDSPISFSLERDITLKTVTAFLTTGTGPMTTSTTQATAFFPSEQAIKSGRHDWPDIQYVLAGATLGRTLEKDFTRVFNLRSSILPEFFKEVRQTQRHQDSFQILNILNQPKSRGDIKLSSRDPFIPPLFNPNYFDRKEDLEVLIEGAKKAVQLIEGSQTFKAIGGRLTTIPFPPCAHLPWRSDQYWECYHRQYSLTVWHPCCTAAMGRGPGDPGAVVDSELRVIGTQRLRVVDASIMPVVVSGNTNAPTIMIAEMGAHFIKSSQSIGAF